MQVKTLDYALEIKEVSEHGIVTGWASTFLDVDQVGDRVMHGAFGKTLGKAAEEGRKPGCFLNHNPDWPIGYWRDMAEKAKGLWVEAQLLVNDIEQARTVYALAKVKAIALSIGYRIPPGGAQPDEKRQGITNLHEIDLREVSFVTMPANLQAKVTSVKSELTIEWWVALEEKLHELDDADEDTVKKSLKEIEGDHLKLGGCPKSMRTFFAKRFAGVRSESGRQPNRGEPEGPKAISAADIAEAFARKFG